MKSTSHPASDREAAPPPSGFRFPDFRRFFAARSLGDIGTETGAIAIPLVAVIALQATPGQVGLLGALATTAFLIIGLPAGVWVERTRRKPVLVAGELCQGLMLLSIPVTWAFGALTIWQLYACVLLGGVATLFVRIAQQSYLPVIVPKSSLLSANSALISMHSARVSGGAVWGAFSSSFSVLP